jgi:hypothetical protein
MPETGHDSGKSEKRDRSGKVSRMKTSRERLRHDERGAKHGERNRRDHCGDDAPRCRRRPFLF